MKIPSNILSIFEKETDGLIFGEVCFTCSMRNGKPRFVITKKVSLYPDDINQNKDSKEGKKYNLSVHKGEVLHVE